MRLGEFEPKEYGLREDFIGFPIIREELFDVVRYLKYLKRQTRDPHARGLLIQAESGCLFLGETGTGKTHALHCVVNEAKKADYHPIDGNMMLQKGDVHPRDVKEFFDMYRSKAEEVPILLVYDDARQLLGHRDERFARLGFRWGGRDIRPVLEEFRRQIDSLPRFSHPAYVIVTSAASLGKINSQIARRFSRHIVFPKPEDESRQGLFRYYLERFGHDPASVDIVALSHLTEGVVAGNVEEIVSRASYKADMRGELTNRLLVDEVTRFLQGPPTDMVLTAERRIQTGYHEFGGHTLHAYTLGLDPILVTLQPSADGAIGKSIHRPSDNIPPSSSRYFFADTVTKMGSTAIHNELERGREKSRMRDLTGAARSALNMYALRDPLAKMALGRDETYLTKGLYSEKGRKEVEAEIEKIKNKALSLASEIVRDHKKEIKTFVEEHLITSQTMVRSEIIDTLKGMKVESGSYHKEMCKALTELGFPAQSNRKNQNQHKNGYR